MRGFLQLCTPKVLEETKLDPMYTELGNNFTVVVLTIRLNKVPNKSLDAFKINKAQILILFTGSVSAVQF